MQTKTEEFFYKYFFSPLVEVKPKDMPIRDWIDFVFCTDTREIGKYRVKQHFLIPGAREVVVPNQSPVLKKFQVVKKGQIIYVRTDSTNPNVVDLEAKVGQTNKYKWFRLTQKEWEYIREKTRKLPWRKGRRSQCFWE